MTIFYKITKPSAEFSSVAGIAAGSAMGALGGYLIKGNDKEATTADRFKSAVIGAGVGGGVAAAGMRYMSTPKVKFDIDVDVPKPSKVKNNKINDESFAERIKRSDTNEPTLKTEEKPILEQDDARLEKIAEQRRQKRVDEIEQLKKEREQPEQNAAELEKIAEQRRQERLDEIAQWERERDERLYAKNKQKRLEEIQNEANNTKQEILENQNKQQAKIDKIKTTTISKRFIIGLKEIESQIQQAVKQGDGAAAQTWFAKLNALLDTHPDKETISNIRRQYTRLYHPDKLKQSNPNLQFAHMEYPVF